MADELPRTEPDLPVVDNPGTTAPGSPCCHLRHKGMYVYTDSVTDDNEEDDGTTIYWCQKTMKDFGPDDQMVCRSDCRNTSRSCYEPF